jgi:diguanylate cyclase (GGDEF)-like protein
MSRMPLLTRLLEPLPAPPRADAVRAAGMLMLAGGLLALLTAVLPPPAEGSEGLIVLVGAIALIVGLVLLFGKPYISENGLAAVALFGTVLITVATHEGGRDAGTADNEILFLWVSLYSFYFLSLSRALIQVAFVGLAYAWLLVETDVLAEAAATRWLVTMTSLVVAGLVVSQLRSSVYRVVDELSERASVDSLTGLLNRNSLNERFVAERARANRDGTPVSVLAVDIDEFKALNDNFGHPVGDRVLRQVAAAIRHWTRRLDAVARVGGDELAVVLPGAGPADALSVADSIRQAIAGTDGPKNVRLSVSIGVTTAEPPVPAFGELWQAADAAMYEAKRSGGDRVRVHGVEGLEAEAGVEFPREAWDGRGRATAPDAAERGLA